LELQKRNTPVQFSSVQFSSEKEMDLASDSDDIPLELETRAPPQADTRPPLKQAASVFAIGVSSLEGGLDRLTSPL